MNVLKVSSFFLLLLLFAISSCNSNDGAVISTKEDFDNYLEEELAFQNIPALAVLIFKEEEIHYEKYLGKTHIAQNIPLANDHLFLLASVSKMVTATALLQLHQKGLFSLDDPINDHLPFEVKSPNSNTPITFQMLLTHTSGIGDGSALDNEYYFGVDSSVALRSFLENYLSPNGALYDEQDNFYNFEPGTQHEYSNTGTALIALLVEEIAQQDFNAYCKENIFQPLGMNNTFWRLDEIAQASKTIVQPYNYKNGNFEAIEHYTFTDYPNGGLRSTALDLHRFFKAFVQRGMSNNYELLKASTIELMISPQIPLIDHEVGLHTFQMNAGNNLWGHDGGEQGVATMVAFNPSSKIGIILLANQGEASLDDLLVEAYRFALQ